MVLRLLREPVTPMLTPLEELTPVNSDQMGITWKEQFSPSCSLSSGMMVWQCGGEESSDRRPCQLANRLPPLKRHCPSSLAGTFVSAFTVLCGARTDLPDRHVCCVFWLNIAAALIQVLTAIVMVGWIMSIFWGMDMVILAISQGYKEQGIPQQL
nr:protein stum homolog [Manis javanica]